MSASPEDWARARADYEAGDATAKALAQRLGVHPSTVGRRGAREGWRTPALGGAPPALSGAIGVQPPDADAPPEGERAGQGARNRGATAQSADNAAPPGLAERLAGDELDAWLDEQVEELREQRAARLGYRPLGWIRRTPW